MIRWIVPRLQIAGVLLSFLVPSAVQAATSKSVRLVISPSGATLRPAETAQFTVRAFDRAGSELPVSEPRWSSSRSSVLTVSGSGTVTAQHGAGRATLSVKAAGATAKITVSVVSTSSEAETPVAADLKQINHVASDGSWIYWTEVDAKTVRLRKSAVGGGPIYDLASENAQTNIGLAVSYVHLRLTSDDVLWTRETTGIYDHWSIRQVPKEGGTVEELLPEDVSVEPLEASGWQVAGSYLTVLTQHPDELDLPDNTRVAALDLRSGEWKPLVQGRYAVDAVKILAATDGAVYLHGQTDAPRTDLLRLDPAGAANDYQTLWSVDEWQGRFTETGAATDTELFYWIGTTGASRLMVLPAAGGSPSRVYGGTFGPGLATDGTRLYWAPKEKQIAALTPGGAVSTLATGIWGTATLGGLALDPDALYFVRKRSGRYIILRVDR